MMSIGILTLHLHLTGCKSLKEKRSRIKPILARLHREFNVSAAEVDLQDIWQDTVLSCALISNDSNHTHRALQSVAAFVENNWPDLPIIDQRIELL
jgi:uncharacterized protein YlxP (DUF503 family)